MCAILCNDDQELNFRQCPGCKTSALDLTPGLFKDLAGSLDAGVIYGTWSFA